MTSAFKTYDIRGEIGFNIDERLCYSVGRAVAQHFNAESVVIGYDARETSPAFSVAVSKGVRDGGADAIAIGLAGTEEMYWAVTEFASSAGIEVTASHNPINYNGIKIVKSHSRPLDDKSDFQVIRALTERQSWTEVPEIGKEFNRATEARIAYVNKVLSFVDVDAFTRMKVVVNSGNGAAGPTFDAIAGRLESLGAPIEFIRVHHRPNSKFPNGIPNPLIPENRAATADVVKQYKADFGVAFDGDFDRCFFFDENGEFIPGEYVIGLLAAIFLEKEVGAKIVHDNRIIWNTQDIVLKKNGLPLVSKTGHAFIKQMMRTHKAVYGGEISAHHYFRDFAYCDSGMIPLVLVAEHISRTGITLGNWVKDRITAFPSSGEYNFRVEEAGQAINKVLEAYRGNALSIDETDGVSLTFPEWRFNLRVSNTEPLVRLNIEVKGARQDLLEMHLKAISSLLE